MFLREKTRTKEGKTHRYWSVVENRWVSGRRVVQRQVLYLGELNDNQRAGWVRTIEAITGEKMDYDSAKRGGYHIGSGDIESANKFISHTRLKRSGAW